ncbi:MAG: 30S ribosomal protein S12 methylthiotransferase RimO [Myxococcota bacterium]
MTPPPRRRRPAGSRARSSRADSNPDAPGPRSGREAAARPAPPRTRRKTPRIGFASLGCPKALVDSERILTQLRAEGYETVGAFAEADLVVVNTCGFITAAVEESLETIGEALAENGKVIVTGCLGAQPEKILARHPKVLAISGPQAYESVVGAVHAHLPPAHDPFLDLLPPQGIKLTPRHYAYLKISEGCNHRCTFCIIPSMRGDLASRPLTEVMREAERLVGAGVKELLVISQDTSAYGVDLRHASGEFRGRSHPASFVGLATALAELDAWVRLHYVYPYPHVDRVIPLMAEGRILPYLDIPFQHASPRILRRMKRPASAADTLARIRRWRAAVPELVLRSTFIVGFPGETDDEFEALLDWLDEAQLDRVGCFPYSPVEGAAANALAGAVPEALKLERQARFMERAAAISARRLAAKRGKTLRVLVDAVDGDVAIARSASDAPEIDGVVRVAAGGALVVGEFADVVVTGSDTYDLEARPAAGSRRRA